MLPESSQTVHFAWVVCFATLLRRLNPFPHYLLAALVVEGSATE
jgi:hypothetical protein